MYRSFIGLGSNLAVKAADMPQLAPDMILKTAVRHMAEQLHIVASSSVFISAPIGPQDQPDFYNAVIEVHHSCDGVALLTYLQQIEQHFLRVRSRHWGERTLDLDILCSERVRPDGQMAEPVIQNSDYLTLPHPQLIMRSFVYIPLLEIAPMLLLGSQKLIDQVLLDIPLREALSTAVHDWTALAASLDRLLLRHCHNSRWLYA